MGGRGRYSGPMTHWRLYEFSTTPPRLASLLGAWADGRREWLGEIEGAGDDLVSFRPYPGGHCAGGIMLHMISCDWHWLTRTCGIEPFPGEGHPALAYDETLNVDEGVWPDPPAEPLAWYLDLLEKSLYAQLGAVAEKGDPLAVSGNDKRDFTQEWVISHLVQHDSYHGGQIVLLNEMLKRRDHAGHG